MNKLKEMFEKKQPALGTFMELQGAATAELEGAAGMDFCIIDNEHGPFDVESSADAIRGAELNGMCPLVRVKSVSRPDIMKPLDVGAAGLIVPFVDTVEQVKSVINYAKYPPIGKRGFASSRKDRWSYAHPGELPLADQMAYWNKEIMVIPQCETMGCLEHIEEVCALEGVDGIFIGPYDLTISMGIPGQFTSPVYFAALDRILKAAKANNKLSMIYANNSEEVKRYFGLGIDAVAYAMDVIILGNAIRGLVKECKG